MPDLEIQGTGHVVEQDEIDSFAFCHPVIVDCDHIWRSYYQWRHPQLAG